MKSIDIKLFPDVVKQADKFKNIRLFLTEISFESYRNGNLKIAIETLGNIFPVENVNIYIGAIFGNIRIMVAGGATCHNIRLGDGCNGIFEIRLWRDSSVIFGSNTSSNGLILVCDNSSFSCGTDCMFSDQVFIQTADQHGIWDLGRATLINNKNHHVELGDHVWVGRRASLTPSCKIGSGSIIGMSSVVSSHIPEVSLAVGNPARVLKSNVSWSRSPLYADKFCEEYFNLNRTLI